MDGYMNLPSVVYTCLRNMGSLQPSRFLFEYPGNNQKILRYNETKNKIQIKTYGYVKLAVPH